MKPDIPGYEGEPTDLLLCVFRGSFLSSLDRPSLSLCRSFATKVVERVLQGPEESTKDGTSSMVAEFAGATRDVDFLASLFWNMAAEGKARRLTPTEALLSQFAPILASILKTTAGFMQHRLQELTADLPEEESPTGLDLGAENARLREGIEMAVSALRQLEGPEASNALKALETVARETAGMPAEASDSGE